MPSGPDPPHAYGWAFPSSVSWDRTHRTACGKVLRMGEKGCARYTGIRPWAYRGAIVNPIRLSSMLRPPAWFHDQNPAGTVAQCCQGIDRGSPCKAEPARSWLSWLRDGRTRINVACTAMSATGELVAEFVPAGTSGHPMPGPLDRGVWTTDHLWPEIRVISSQRPLGTNRRVHNYVRVSMECDRTSD